jgi:hypothetical protein
MSSIGDWQVKVTGAVVRVEREDVDKSGKNPRYFYTFVVAPSGLDGVPAGAELPVELPVRIKGAELEALTKKAPKAGDKVVLRARASGARPKTFYLVAIE